MKLKFILFAFCFLTASFALFGQVAKDAVVPLTATVNSSPLGITLTWSNPTASNLLILRHTKGVPPNIWVQVLNVANSTLTSGTDNMVSPGQTYEYVIQRVTTINAFGYAHVAVNAPVVDNRGKVLVIVDSTTADALGVELVRMKNDMRGDGWIATPMKIGPSATVQSVKNMIVAAYNADPANVKAVFLVGRVPVPYSGDDTSWDGRDDHYGAWPADSYYADVDGIWTDDITNTTPSRAANINLPGDGKFDQDFIPSAVELQVGRLDFRHLTQATFGLSEIELLRRYLDKNHRWRTKQYVVDNKALVDDNFGYAGGEAFAADGFRNANTLVGTANVVAADFFNGTETQSYLMGYGCGASLTYTGADGVGTSANFGVDSVNIVFTNLFGDYTGDWDYETDPFMPSALASRGGILTCGWAGRPHVFQQALASGETIGYCNLETQNAQFDVGFFGSFGESGAHVSLLGDPTLRARIVAPPSNITTSAACTSVTLNWTASSDPNVSGYHVYRSLSNDGPYTRLTTNTVSGTTYVDASPIVDTLFYQVRAIKTETNPGGGIYTNNSVGPITYLVYNPVSPAVDLSSTLITCNENMSSLTVSSTPNGASYIWAGPGGYTSTVQNPMVSIAGNYTVTVTFADGCTNTAVNTVFENKIAPVLTALVSGEITCSNPTATITITADVSVVGLCVITGPNGFQALGMSVNVTIPGAYTITAVGTNGCTGFTTVFVSQNTTAPLAFATGGALSCATTSVTLSGSSSIPGSTYLWTGPNGFSSTLQNPSTGTAGPYQLAVTAQNGCIATASTTVVTNFTPPTALPIPTQLSFNCTTPCVSLPVPAVPGHSLFLDNDPLTPGEIVTICNAGQYTITVQLDASGCTQDYNVEVIADLAEPGVTAGSDGGQITCAIPAVQLMANSPASGATYAWVGPNGFSSNLQNPSAASSGTYTVTATGSNGCTSSDDITINQDGSVPTANATGGTLTCIDSMLTLFGTTDTPGATYLWTGPGNFTSTLQNPTVSVPGLYIFEVTASNGCKTSTSAQVTANLNGPSVFVPNFDQLTCLVTCVTIQATSGTPGVTVAPVEFCSPGTYLISATDPVNGCSTSVPVTVDQDIAVPNITLPALEVLNCNTPCITIQATSNTPGVVIDPVLICDAGPFTIIATNPANGCTNSVTSTITEASALAFDGNTTTIIDCAGNIFIGVQGTGGTPPYHYLWSTGETTPSITIPAGAPNTISVTITDEGGCSVSAGPITIPTPLAVVFNSAINSESAPGAHDGSITIVVNGGVPPFTYLWNTGATSPSISNLAGGTYTATVTGANGCTAVFTGQVNTIVGTQETGIFQSLSLAPNPTDGSAILQFRLPESAPVGISIYDAMGRLVWEKSAFDALEASVPIDLSGKPQGMYSVAIRVGDQVVTRKLAVLR